MTINITLTDGSVKNYTDAVDGYTIAADIS